MEWHPSQLVIGDEVAIMSDHPLAAPIAIQFCKVAFVGQIYLQLENDGMYTRLQGTGIGNSRGTYIVPTEEEEPESVGPADDILSSDFK